MGQKVKGRFKKNNGQSFNPSRRFFYTSLQLFLKKVDISNQTKQRRLTKKLYEQEEKNETSNFNCNCSADI